MRVWSPRNGTQLNEFKGFGFHDAGVTCIAFSADGTHVVTGSTDNTGTATTDKQQLASAICLPQRSLAS